MVLCGRKLYYLPFSILMVSSGSFGHIFVKCYFFVMDRYLVRIRLPCVDDSIKYEHNLSKKC